MSGHLRRFHSKKVSKLDQFVTVVAINNYEPNVHDTKFFFDERLQTPIFNMPLFRGPAASSPGQSTPKTNCGDIPHGKLGMCLTLVDCVM
jgi:hypothetical protein